MLFRKILARMVLKNSIVWEEAEDKKDSELTLKRLGVHYTGTKNIIHERVEFNRMTRAESETMSQWETR